MSSARPGVAPAPPDACCATALIRRKRDGGRLDAPQLRAVAEGIANGWSEGQVGAFAMAVAWRGLQPRECRDFTLALRDSGQRLSWGGLPGPVLDKHSTGGVGDCVSLLLAPLVAACGGYVPMLSGRGLGHTGGTLDKLESLRGYQVEPSAERLRAVVAAVGCAIVGAGSNLAPAERRLYAVRDVTATVDVPDLIVASILSKKLASGSQALVLDVKTGSGAILPDAAAGRALAARLLAVARDCGLPSRVMLSDMGQVLGRDAGNALEVAAVLELLCHRRGCARLQQLVLAQAAALLQLGGLAASMAQAEQQLDRAWSSGAAAETFARMVAALGGPRDLLERPWVHLPNAPVQLRVAARRSGIVATIDVRAVGDVIVALGGGRRRPDQAIDHAVGLSQVLGRGEPVQMGEPLAVVHARTPAMAQAAATAVSAAFTIDDAAPEPSLLYQWLPEPDLVGAAPRLTRK
jgi:thymidine phosphorylase